MTPDLPLRDTSLDQWVTEDWLARWLVAWACLQDDDVVLEAGAGYGAIVRAIPQHLTVWAVEMDWRLRPILLRSHPRVIVSSADFLDPDLRAPVQPTVSVQNPPYSKPLRGIDGRFLSRTLDWVPRCIALVHDNIFYGQARRRRIWNRACLTRVCHFEDRPQFDRLPSLDGKEPESPATNYCAIEIRRRQGPDDVSQAKHTWVKLDEIREAFGGE